MNAPPRIRPPKEEPMRRSRRRFPARSLGAAVYLKETMPIEKLNPKALLKS